MSATLTVRREATGFELRRGQFDILLDGTTAGSIEWHQTEELPLEPGRHTLQIRRGRYTSNAEAFEVDDQEAVSFRCHGAMLWPRFVASIVVPSLAISLRRE